MQRSWVAVDCWRCVTRGMRSGAMYFACHKLCASISSPSGNDLTGSTTVAPDCKRRRRLRPAVCRPGCASGRGRRLAQAALTSSAAASVAYTTRCMQARTSGSHLARGFCTTVTNHLAVCTQHLPDCIAMLTLCCSKRTLQHAHIETRLHRCCSAHDVCCIALMGPDSARRSCMS